MELSQRLALSWPTILQNVKELVELGLVQEVGQYESTGGRKAKAYAPVREARLAIGLDLTGNHVSVVLVDLSGQVVRYQRKSRPFSLDSAYLQGLGELFPNLKAWLACFSTLRVGVHKIATCTPFNSCKSLTT